MRRLLMLTMMTLVMAVGVRTQPPTSTHGQMNGWAWDHMSPADKLVYLDGVEAGLKEGWIAAVSQVGDKVDCVKLLAVPPSWFIREGGVKDVDEFYRVTANATIPIGSAYVYTRRAKR